MDSHKDEDFARLNRLAAALFQAPSAAIAVVDAQQAWLVSALGTDLRQIPIEHSLAAHTIAEDGPVLALGDVSADPRFAASMVVTGEPGIRFYVGAPITVEGQRIGALQVFAPEPRDDVMPGAFAQLADLAATAGSLFELKHQARVRARTAAELIKEEWRHALTLEAGKVGSWVWDLRTGEVVANDIFRRMYGLVNAGSVHIDQVMGAIQPDDRRSVEAALRATFKDGVDYAAEFRIAATGRWVVGRGRVYERDAGDRPQVMMGVNIDVSEAREVADHTRLLLRELNHRVKNTLAMIQSLARQTLRHTPDPQRFMNAFAGRLRTLSEAHALLSDRDWSGIGLVELIETQVRPYAGDGAGNLRIVGEEVRLPPDHALGLGIVLHELTSNAAQYGALTAAGGEVSIDWSIAEGPRELDLHWTERGGPKVNEPREPGFGTRLIAHGLDKILDSRVELKFQPAGVEARIHLPLG